MDDYLKHWDFVQFTPGGGSFYRHKTRAASITVTKKTIQLAYYFSETPIDKRFPVAAIYEKRRERK